MCETDVYMERYELAIDRIRAIPGEHFGLPALETYFAAVVKFLLLIDENKNFLEREGGISGASPEQLKIRNQELYEDILPEHYGCSYANPAYAVSQLGEELGAMLAFLYAELRSMIGFCYEGKQEELVIRMELFTEVYTAVVYEWQESGRLPGREDIRNILYWFVSDYADVAAERRVREQVCPEGCFAADIIRNSDLTDLRYLYAYGEYVSESVLEMAEFLNSLPEETIAAMADTYTEGYRIGFEVTGKDLSKKKTVALYYQIGFERMMKRAMENFEKMGLKPVIFRNAASVLDNPSLSHSGFYGAAPGRQYEYDHKDDRALFLDKNYVNRRLEVTRTAFEKYKEQAGSYAGPAVLELFGEQTVDPVSYTQ
ncbi:MAG: leucyl aminopeptidase, partial [Acetatifactor sp.]|nr:leucyl aminopeptidase [Acetatifactor sp.]